MRRAPAPEWAELARVADEALTVGVQLAAQLRLIAVAAERRESPPAVYWADRIAELYAQLGPHVDRLRTITDTKEISTCKI